MALQKRVDDISLMTSLSLSRGSNLAKIYCRGFKPLEVTVSKDGTAKYLSPPCADGLLESVVIPDGERTNHAYHLRPDAKWAAGSA